LSARVEELMGAFKIVAGGWGHHNCSEEKS